MQPFLLWKFLHIATMFFAVALAVSGEIVVRHVAGSRDVRAIRVVVRRVRPLSGNVATALFIAGLAFGILAALSGQIDLLRPWLLASYAVFALAIVVGAAVTDPWMARLEALSASSGDEPSDELLALIADRRALIATVVLMLLMVVLVFLMVVKPLG